MTNTSISVCSQVLSNWACDFNVVRFNDLYRSGAENKTLADFFEAVKTPKSTPKEKRPAWSLCNDTGTNEGRENGLIQLDFDHLECDPEEFKAALSEYPGILFAALSASRRNVFALIYAPDREAGIYAARHIAGYMKSLGFTFERDESCDKAAQLRLESDDPAPYIAPICEPIAPDYLHELQSCGARPAFEFWTNGAPFVDDYEAAATAIYAAAISANIWSKYGLSDKKFRGAADVQIIGESGGAKTEGRIKPLRRVAQARGVRLVGGLRTTDASFYDDFIDAACDTVTDEKGKVTSMVMKTTPDGAPNPDPLACILDESGDTETSRAGNQNKTQQNLIRRIAAFDGEIGVGHTAEQRKYYGRALPDTLPARLFQYRATTPNQLKNVDFADQQAGGNARRTLYAVQKPAKRNFLAIDDLNDKSQRVLSTPAFKGLMDLSDTLAELFPRSTETVFTAQGVDVARQAAKLAFEQAQIPEVYADTILYNTALHLAAIRVALAYQKKRDLAFDAEPERPETVINAEDLRAATAIALNSFRVVRALTARSAGEKLAAARTETEKTRLVIEYINGRKNRMIARDNLTRYFGRDVMKTVQALCEEGVLREVVKVNEAGKNPHTYFEVTPAGGVEKAAAEYAAKQAKKAPKTRRRESDTPIEKRLELYAEQCDMIGLFDPTQNDNSLRSFAGKLRKEEDFRNAPETETWFRRFVTSGRFNTPGRPAYTEKDAARLWRKGSLSN